MQLWQSFEFVIALLEIEFQGFGTYFWTLVIGVGDSMPIKGDILGELHEETQ